MLSTPKRFTILERRMLGSNEIFRSIKRDIALARATESALSTNTPLLELTKYSGPPERVEITGTPDERASAKVMQNDS